MEKQFMNSIPPVINYYQRAHKSSIICWPVYAYKIIAPAPNESKNNIFQKLILKMAKVGYWENSIITEITKLDERFITYIKNQLISRGLLTEYGQITEQGILEIKDQNLLLDDLTTGYIFQDPFTSALLNQFSTNLQFADVDRDNTNQNTTKRERVFVDDGDSKYTFWVNYKNLPNPKKPDAYEVLSSVTNFTQITKYSEQSLEDNSENSGFLQSKLEQINFINEAPELFYLLVQTVYDENERTWEILNPFGYNIFDNKFKSFVQQRVGTDNNLEKYLLQNYNKQSNLIESVSTEVEETKPTVDKIATNEIINEEVGSVDIDPAKSLIEADLKHRDSIINNLTDEYGEYIKETKLFETHIVYSVLENQVQKFNDFQNTYTQDKFRLLSLRASNVLADFIKQLLMEEDFTSIIPIHEFDDDREERRKNLVMMLRIIGYNRRLPEGILLSYCSKKQFETKIKNIHNETEKPLLTIFLFSLSSNLFDGFTDVIKNDEMIIDNMLKIFDIRNKKSIAHTSSLVPSSADLQIIMDTIKTIINYYYKVYSGSLKNGKKEK